MPQIVDDLEDGPAQARPVIVDDLEPVATAAPPRIVDDLDAPAPQAPALTLGNVAQSILGASPWDQGPMQDAAQAVPGQVARYAAEHPREAGAMAARTGGQMLGAMGGGALGGPAGAIAGAGGGAALAEPLAQLIEGRDQSPAEMIPAAIGGALGQAIPGGGVLKQAAAGGVLGAVDSVGRNIARGEDIDPEAAANAAALSSAFGAGFAAAHGLLSGKGKAPIIADDLAAPAAAAPEPPVRIVDDLNAAPSSGFSPSNEGANLHPPAETSPAGTSASDGIRPEPVVSDQQPSLLTRFARAGQDAPAPIDEGPLSAVDPEKLAPSYELGLDERLTAMNQELATGARADVAGARRGSVPVAQTHREAAALGRAVDAYAAQTGMSPQEVTEALRRPGEGVNAAQVEYLRQRNESAVADAVEAAIRAREQPTPENIEAGKLAAAHVIATIQQRSSALAEAGRAVGIARYPEGPAGVVQRAVDTLNRYTPEQLGDFFDFLGRPENADNPAGVNAFVQQALPATTRQKIHEAWVSGLMGPITQVKNTASNAINIPLRIAERAITGAVTDPLRVAAGRTARAAGATRLSEMFGTTRERYAGEALADLRGTLGNIPAAARNAREAFRSEIPSEGGARFLEPGAARQAIKGRAGRLIRLPLRGLLAADEAFKTLARGGERSAQALRQATSEGLRGDARRARAAELVAHPTEAMHEAEDTAARYWTFQQQLGEIGQLAITARRKIPGAEFVAPFIQTPINTAKFALERNPLSALYVIREAARGNLRGGALAEQATRTLVGVAMASAVADAWRQGLITGGGPRDPGKRRAWLQTHQPYSAKFGDRWVGYGAIEPLGGTVGMVADALDIWGQADQQTSAMQLATTIAQSIGVNLSNKTFLSGVSDFLQATTEPDPDKAEKWWQSALGSMVPAPLGQLARAMDPTMRKPRTEGDVIRGRILGLTGEVPPQRDIWGEPIRREGFIGPDHPVAGTIERLFSPITVRTEASDPASREVARLKIAYGLPQRSFTVGGQRIEYGTQEFDQLLQDSGRLAKAAVTRLVAQPAYQRADDEMKAEMIRRAIVDAREQVRPRVQRDVLAAMRRSGGGQLQANKGR